MLKNTTFRNLDVFPFSLQMVGGTYNVASPIKGSPQSLDAVFYGIAADDKVRKPSDAENYTTSSEAFGVNFYPSI
jgi:hypothetical protein